MSERFPGGFITRTPPVPTTASASGIWSIEQAMEYQKAGTWPYGGPFTYIEDVFSTYVYTGNGSTQTITNGIDLSTKGGLVWLKNRTGTYDHWLWDTARGAGYTLRSNLTNAQANIGTTEGVSFTTSGFSMGNNINWNGSSLTATSWTFRKQPKFFDIVTWTGNGSATQTISHNLGSAPGCIMVKLTSGVNGWDVYHRSLGTSAYVQLNTTAASTTISNVWGTINSTTFTATGTLGQNDSGATYVAYLFAHDAGGFGLTGTDNVISCGSFTTNGSGVANVTLGYEPQFVMIKPSSAVGDWVMLDTTRGWAVTGGPTQMLKPNSTSAEASLSSEGGPNATGFGVNAIWLSTTCIYVAIRKGPMKVPTSGTSVFGLSARSGTGANATVTGGQLADAIIVKNRGSAVASLTTSRLIGGGTYLITSSTTTETNAGSTVLTFPVFDVMDGYRVGSTSTITNASGSTYINYLFKRAPSFMDVVCGTSDASGNTFTSSHNLTVAPELLIIKSRGAIDNWWTIQVPAAKFGTLNGTGMANTLTSGIYTGSASTFSFIGYVGNSTTHVAYLFATCAGVSKVGSYTGNGSSQTIACGFTAGARFILIKRTDSTGDWYVWDTARGIVAGNDPHLSLNTTAAEVTTDDTIDTANSGFIVNQLAATNVNVTSATYIFLAIA